MERKLKHFHWSVGVSIQSNPSTRFRGSYEYEYTHIFLFRVGEQLWSDVRKEVQETARL